MSTKANAAVSLRLLLVCRLAMSSAYLKRLSGCPKRYIGSMYSRKRAREIRDPCASPH